MAYLGAPKLILGKPEREAPNKPGTANVRIEIPLFVERLERCFALSCNEAVRDPIYEIRAEVWSSDRNEPFGTIPLPLGDRVQFAWRWTINNSNSRRIAAGELTAAAAVTGSPSILRLDLNDARDVEEHLLNEDHGPFPPPGKSAPMVTRDELFLRVYLSTVFSSWQVIQTIDSSIVTGQFYGP